MGFKLPLTFGTADKMQGIVRTLNSIYGKMNGNSNFSLIAHIGLL